METMFQTPIESNFSSRTVTEQSVCHSFIADSNIKAKFNISKNLEIAEDSPRDESSPDITVDNAKK